MQLFGMLTLNLTHFPVCGMFSATASALTGFLIEFMSYSSGLLGSLLP
jgi:hypothetical protein